MCEPGERTATPREPRRAARNWLMWGALPRHRGSAETYRETPAQVGMQPSPGAQGRVGVQLLVWTCSTSTLGRPHTPRPINHRWAICSGSDAGINRSGGAGSAKLIGGDGDLERGEEAMGEQRKGSDIAHPRLTG